ncbi:hypothetical protein Vretimale_16080 [Volvox reticuliferus]|uniref:SRCR domain-containing protein n=2 Tax=Volvox reticuliferus TaxID=1737510 RepID=A0A8J4LVR1_9CHLO|nr:hypothetical protein Vretimale_16080 [Volvox reticuliferus]
MALTLQQLFHLGVIAVLSLQFLGGSVEARKVTIYEKNGVRLVGGTKSAGRVEVLPMNSANWVQVCGDETFSDSSAQALCQMLGYNFGRKYYTTETALPLNPNNVASWLRCYPKNNGRRLNEEVIMSGDDDLAEDANHHAARQGRKLRSVMAWYINATSKAPFSCQFRVSICNPAGPVAGLQCAKTLKQLPPASPPPPSPPTPPPSPPAVANTIRIFMNIADPTPDGRPEPNLCNNPNTSSICPYNGRVEIEVGSPDSSTPGKIWAPVCNVADSLLAERVARLACTQRFQEKARPWLPNKWFISASVSSIPFYIPPATQAVNTGDFDPAAVKGYVTITGGNVEGAQKLQDLQYQVSTNPCADGAMFAFYCYMASNDGAIP